MGQDSNNFVPGKVDMQKLKRNKFYQNHLRALEMKREEEKADAEACKVLIMQYAD